MKLGVLGHRVDHLAYLPVDLEAVVVLDADGAIVQARAELVDQVGVEERGPLLERVVQVQRQWRVGRDAQILLRLPDLYRRDREQGLEHRSVDGDLGSPHLVEDEARVAEVMNHLELEVNGVDPVPECRFVDVLRKLPDGNLFLVDALVPAMRAAFSDPTARALAVDVSLREAKPVLDVALEHVELGLDVGPELDVAGMHLLKQRVAASLVLVQTSGELLQPRVKVLRLVEGLHGLRLLAGQNLLLPLHLVHCLRGQRALPLQLHDGLARLRVEVLDERVHPLLVVREPGVLLDDDGVVRVDRVLDRLAFAQDEAVDARGDLRLQTVQHVLDHLHGQRHGCGGRVTGN